jgi:hypothetical protein
MLDLPFISSIAESTQYRSKSYIKHVTSRDIANHAYLDLIGLWILYNEYGSQAKAVRYAKDTLKYGGFVSYSQSSNDLHTTLNILAMHKTDMIADDAESKILLDRISIDVPTITFYLRQIANNNLRANTARGLLLRMESGFMIDESNYRSIRRIAQSWDTADTAKKKLAITRMTWFYRQHAKRSEIYKMLVTLAASKNFLIPNTADPERPSIATAIAGAAVATGAGFVAGRAFGKFLSK